MTKKIKITLYNKKNTRWTAFMMPALLYGNESWIISAQINRIVDITAM